MQVLAICCMSILLVSLDNTIVNVALPTIHRDLGASLSQLQWTIDAYTVVLATLLILSGSIADRIGRKRIFTIGLALFSAGSLLCSAAPSPGLADRVPRHPGRGRIDDEPGRDLDHPQRRSPTRASARRRSGSGAASSGSRWRSDRWWAARSTDAAGWRSIFWINVPIGLLAIVLSRAVVPESRAERPRRLDPLGQVLAMVFLATLTYAIIEGGDAGWSSTRVGRRRSSPWRALIGVRRARASRAGAADRPALLPQRAVHRRDE